MSTRAGRNPEALSFDGALKDLFLSRRPALINRLTGGSAVQEFLNVELPQVQERRADLMLSVEDGSILHIEFQTRNQTDMACRVAIYHLLMVQRFPRRRLRHVVLYAGAERMRMKGRLDTGPLQFSCELIDLRTIPVDDFLQAGRAADCALAILGQGATERLPELAAAVARLPESEQGFAAAAMVVLGALRAASGKVEEELFRMGLTIDVSKNTVFQRIRSEGFADGKLEGKAEGKAEGLQAVLALQIRLRFGQLPRWAETRLKRASVEQLESWAARLLTAAKLEDVIGKRPAANDNAVRRRG